PYTEQQPEKRQIEEEFVERSGLTAYALLHQAPGQIGGGAEGIAPQQIAQAANGLRERKGAGKDIPGGVPNLAPPLDHQRARVAAEEAARPGLTAVPQGREVLDKSLRPQEEQHAGLAADQAANERADGDEEHVLGGPPEASGLTIGDPAADGEGGKEAER